MSHADQFRAAIAEAGLTPPDQIIGDGKLHRFSTNGKPRDEAGYYIFHDDDRPAGAFGCWRSQISGSWKSDSHAEFTPEQRKEWADRKRQIEEQREAERRAAAARAAEKAAKMWEAGHDAADRAHDYLSRKKIPGIGARVLRDMLLIPMRLAPGALCGLQVIQPDGSRKFLTGTPAGGAYTTIGRPTKTGPIVICEGYATGVSIHVATGYCVVVAFSASNLSAVAAKIRAALPDAVMVIAADDDFKTDGNPGLSRAREAAVAVSGLVSIPRWSGDRGDGTDLTN